MSLSRWNKEKAPAVLRPSRYVFCMFQVMGYCKDSSTQQHHELRVLRSQQQFSKNRGSSGKYIS
ncbi:hypothetical protein Bca101_043645 [Brassica carinata]